jgi:uncharacterized protein (TIGR03000 family)
MNRCKVGLLVGVVLLWSATEVQAQWRRPFRPWWPRPIFYPPPYPLFFPYQGNANPYNPGMQQAGYGQPATDTPPTDNRARIAIRLPSTVGDVWVDDYKMADKIDNERLFVSPPLEAGHTYTYTIKVRFVRRFENVVEERVVHVRPNETTTVDFDTPAKVTSR